MGMPEIVGSEVTICQAITDIVESVALEQTALSHILNAEGEKLQAIIGTADITTEELLLANKSVQGMVESVTRLEMMLQSKLSLFSDVIGTSCELPR